MTRAQDVDTAWVADRMRARVPFSAMARMAGCNEVDLRRHHDLTAMTADWLQRPENPRETVRFALVQQGFSRDEALILARLWMSNGARCKSADLAAGIVGGEAARELCAEAKRRAWTKGIGFEQGPGGYALSAQGIAKISKLAGFERGRP